jgi:GWxTD domain-containing protein
VRDLRVSAGQDFAKGCDNLCHLVDDHGTRIKYVENEQFADLTEVAGKSGLPCFLPGKILQLNTQKCIPVGSLRSSLKMSFNSQFRYSILALTVFASLAAFGQSSDEQKSDTNNKKTPSAQEVDPLKRDISPEQQKKNAKAFKKEVGQEYKKWLENDVKWIITSEELSAFKQLSNDEERDQFIEAFWQRRDPTPDTVENEFKEEHYRRIAYANEHFASGVQGWRTDRGRIYVVFGPPDTIDSHPSGGQYQRPQEEGGGSTSTYPFETWRYRYIEGIGNEVEIEFVDDCMCGKYEMTMDRSKKDALLNVPGAGLTDYESMGLASKTDRFSGGMERLGRGAFNSDIQSKQFDRLEQFAKLNRAPSVKFKDLEEVVSTKIRYNLMPFDVRVDFVKVTEDTVLVPITIQIKNKDVTFVEKEGVSHGLVNIFGRVTTLTGRVAQTFEDTVSIDVPKELLPNAVQKSSVYWKALPLRSGRYRVDVVVKDVANGEGRLGTWRTGILVPNMGEDRGLVASTLILADKMEKVPTRDVGTGSFVIGTTKVRPRVNSADGKPTIFKKTEKINFWMQVYNLGVDQKTNKSSATIEYEIVNTATNQPVVHTTENSGEGGNTGDQFTVEKSLSLASVPPGVYQLNIKVNDNISKQTINPIPSAKFAVE